MPPRRTPPRPGPPRPRPALAWPATRPQRRRSAAAVITLTLIVGALLMPTGKVADRPGGILDLDQRVTIDGSAPVTPLNGSYDGLTVRTTRLNVGGLAFHYLFDRSSQLVSADTIVPHGVSPEVYHQYEKGLFINGGQVAAAVAERALGYEVAATSDGLEVLAVTPGSSADGVIKPGEVITAVDGRPVSLQADLSQAVQGASGEAVSLELAGVDQPVMVSPSPLPGSTRPVLGVLVVADQPRIDLPVPVEVDSSGVVGPSAGLLTALTIYDKLSPTDVAAGRRIAGTGTLALDGTVGPIGGIEAKARAARAAGATLFLAPAGQADSARAVLGDRIPVVGVTTFAQALQALGS